MNSIFDIVKERPQMGYVTFKAGEGRFELYSKEPDAEVGTKKDLGERIMFLPLYETATITGYVSAMGEGYRANEIKPKDARTATFNLKLGKTLVKSGTWQAIKGTQDAKYTACIYALLVEESQSGTEYYPVCVKLHGSALNAWIDAAVRIGEAKIITMQKDVLVDQDWNEKSKKFTKRAIPYYKSVCQKHQKNRTVLGAAMPFAKEVADFFADYFSRPEPSFFEAEQDLVLEEPATPVEAGEIFRTAPWVAPVETAPVWLDNAPEDDLPF